MADLNLVLRLRADLRQAIRQLDRAEKELRQLGPAGRAAGQGARAGAAGIERFGTTAERASRGANLLRSAVAGFTFAYFARQTVRAVDGLKDLGLTFEALNQRFTFATGSVAEGAREMAFVREEADRLGISFLASAGSYSKLAAAVRGTNIDAAQTREIFLGIAEASSVLRLSADQVEGAYRAIEQVASKGTVQAEELRGQLGERIPGAFQIAARAMGVTTAELNKMLELGEVLADDFLPRFAAQLRREFAEGVPEAADSAAASFARLGNSIERRLERAIRNSSLLQWLAQVSDALREIIDLSGRTPAESATAELERIVRGLEAGAGEGFRVGDLFGRGFGRDEADTALRKVIDDNGRISAELAASIRARGLGIEESLLEAAQGLQGARLRYFEEAERALAADPLAQGRFSTAVGRQTLERRREQVAQERERERRQRDENFGLFTSRRGDIEPGPVAPDVDAFEKAFGELERLYDRYSLRSLDGEEKIREAYRRRFAELREQYEAAVAAAGDNDELSLKLFEENKNAEIQLADNQQKDLEAFRERQAEVAERTAEREARAADQAARRELDARRQVTEALQDAAADDGLISRYDQEIIRIERWREANLQALADVGLAHSELADRVEAEARRQRDALEEARTPLGAARRGLRDYAADSADVFGQIEDATVNAFRGMEDALVEFVQTGKLSFTDLANTIIADLARIAIRSQITGPLAEVLGLGNPFAVAHSGAIAGQLGGRSRNISPAAFIGARRMHGGGISGLRSDEVPTILKKGEGVFTPEQMAAIGGLGPREVAVNIDNRGTPQRVTEVRATVDFRGLVISAVTEDILTGGDTFAALEAVGTGASL